MPQFKSVPSLSAFSTFGDAIVSVKAGSANYGGGTDSKGSNRFRKEIVPQGTIQPAYPKKAAERKIEGWVEVEFTIDRRGWVKEVLILNAEPKGIFEQKTVEAVYKWKFEPIDMPVRARQRVEFTLDQLQYYLNWLNALRVIWELSGYQYFFSWQPCISCPGVYPLTSMPINIAVELKIPQGSE